MINQKSRDAGLMHSLKALIEKFTNYLLLILVAVLAVSLARNVGRIQSAGQQIKNAENKVEKLKEEQKELEESLSIVKSEEYMEKQLRDKLGMAREGEIVVILPDEETVKKFAPKLEEEQDSLPDPNWKKWMKLLGIF